MSELRSRLVTTNGHDSLLQAVTVRPQVQPVLKLELCHFLHFTPLSSYAYLPSYPSAVVTPWAFRALAMQNIFRDCEALESRQG